MKQNCSMAFLLMAALLCSCQGSKNENVTLQPVKVKVMKVSAGAYANAGHYSGTVEEENGTALSFSVSGTVQKVNIHLGQRMQAGQLIATLDPTTMQNAYNAARAALAQAEDSYRRMKELHDKGSLPEIKWVEVQSQVEQARSSEQIAAKNLRDCKLYAPYSGVISEKNIEVGQNVMPGTPVAHLVTASLLKVKIAVPENEIASVSIGQKATVSVTALDGKSFPATVIEKGIVANPLSRSYDVKLRVTDSEGQLMPGMVTEATLSLPEKEEQDNVCLIPAHIVQLDEQNNRFVWLNKDGHATKCVIRIGEFNAKGVTVLAGLKAGDEIIVKGQQKVCEGTEVSL